MSNVELEVFDANQLQSAAHYMLQEALKRGATAAEVSMAAGKGFSVSAHNGDVETVEYHQDKAIDIIVYFGKRRGAASLSDIRPNAMSASVEAACHIAKFTDEDPDAGLGDKKELAFNYPQLELAYPWSITVDQAIKMACDCEREALSLDKRIISAESVKVITGGGQHLYANTQGFLGFFPATKHEISCVLVAKDQDEMQRDYGYTIAVDPNLLDPTSVVAKHAVERSVSRLGARRLKTMKVPVIFIAEEARSLLGHFISAIKGSSLYRKASFLTDHLGKKIFPDFMHMQEHPYLPRGLGSSPFDEDGVATRSNVFVEDGILSSYALGIYSARKLGLTTTGNAGGVHNLTVKTGKKDLSALLKTMNRGLLVTELMGHGVNVLTGDYSRGASGFWVEHGEIQYPVHEITIAGNLSTMYAQVQEIGNDVDVRGNILTGSILIEEMMVAGD